MEGWRVCFDFCEVYYRLIEVRRVRFDYRQACRTLVEVQRVHFDYRQSCGRLVGNLWKFGEYVLNSAKCIIASERPF